MSDRGAARPVAAATRTRTLGSLHEFRPDSEELSTYMERVEIYFASNDVPEDKKVPVFLNAIGGSDLWGIGSRQPHDQNSGANNN